MAAEATQQPEKVSKHKACLDDAVGEIRRSEFVSLDLEFSGLSISNIKYETVEDYYLVSRQSVPSFLAVELGLCCVRRDPDNDKQWILTPFTFPLYPSRRTLFYSDSISLSWLIQQGFDIQKWVDEG
eukprot:Blabericola_migrator_1__8379@NODE_4361_length_1199_cov_12_540636_g2697_i0_p2_GENE_NODE_4361_length_1199_cov_12_540636_g2697_i0NODE_4361_length_1199_cov_12_540636_g2697_i0_p2_ORF_typecomplete_len138_score24_35CAF1/PF04857_20/7_8e19_NODE_4361_length_1199_cov_12_540636_g2697_i035415